MASAKTDREGNLLIEGDLLLDEGKTVRVNGVDVVGTGGLSEEAVQALIDTSINGLINGAPGALDTLNELSAALGDDENFASTVANALTQKVTAVYPSSAHAEGFSINVSEASLNGGAAQIRAGANTDNGANGGQISIGSGAESGAGGGFQLLGGASNYPNDGALLTLSGGSVGAAGGGDVILQSGSSDDGGQLASLTLEGGTSVDGQCLIVCRNFICQLPTSDPGIANAWYTSAGVVMVSAG